MSIDALQLIRDCVDVVNRNTVAGVGGGTVRRPDRPMLFLFLGTHPKEGVQAAQSALRTGWPSHYNSIAFRTYKTPGDYTAAQEYIDRGNDAAMELEDLIVDQCSPKKGYQSHTNVQLVYFLNLNDQYAPEFIDLLDQPLDIPVGGLKSRYIFAMSKVSRRIDHERMKERLRTLHDKAVASQGSVWDNSYLFSISNSLFSAAILEGDAYHEGYDMAAEVMLMLNSVRQQDDPTFTPVRASSDGANIMTAALLRQKKPTEEIVRTVLNQYLLQSVERCKTGSGSTNAPEPLAYCKDLYGQLYNNFILPNLPGEEALAGLPTATADPAIRQAIWAAYEKTWFEDNVHAVLGTPKELQEKFTIALQGVYNCTAINVSFGNLIAALSGEANPFRVAASYSDQGEYPQAVLRAKNVLADRVKTAVLGAATELMEDAKSFVWLLGDLQNQIVPMDGGLGNYYRSKVQNFLASDRDEDSRLGNPCNEDQLQARLLSFFKSLVNRDQTMRLSFWEELKVRVGAAQAANMLANVLAITPHMLMNQMRMRLPAANQMGDAILMDPNAERQMSIPVSGQKFAISSADRVDRIGLYSFRIDQVL